MTLLSKSKKVRVWLIAAVCLLGLPAIALAWTFGQTGNAQMYFKDGSVAVTSGSLAPILTETFSTSGTRVVFGKVVVSNASSNAQTVSCRLEVFDTNTSPTVIVCSDLAQVTLPSQNSTATLPMHCAQSATTAQVNHAYFSRISCARTAAGTVNATWSKITSVFEDNSPNGEVFVTGGT